MRKKNKTILCRFHTGRSFLLFLLTGLMIPVFFCAAEDSMLLAEAYFNREENLSCWMDVPQVGFQRYYAQNDTLWGDLIYESSLSTKKRPFRDGGCNPTALAMAVRNLLDTDELSQIREQRQLYSFCVCSINASSCASGHARYLMTSERDYDRFLPLIFASFASGNNASGEVSRTEDQGTKSGYIHLIAELYHLRVQFTTDFSIVSEALQDENTTVMGVAARGGAFTNVGHYVYIAGISDTTLYVLDPLARDQYKTKNASILNILTPGLVSLDTKDLEKAGLYSYILFTRMDGVE